MRVSHIETLKVLKKFSTIPCADVRQNRLSAWVQLIWQCEIYDVSRVCRDGCIHWKHTWRRNVSCGETHHIIYSVLQVHKMFARWWLRHLIPEWKERQVATCKELLWRYKTEGFWIWNLFPALLQHDSASLYSLWQVRKWGTFTSSVFLLSYSPEHTVCDCCVPGTLKKAETCQFNE